MDNEQQGPQEVRPADPRFDKSPFRPDIQQLFDDEKASISTPMDKTSDVKACDADIDGLYHGIKGFEIGKNTEIEVELEHIDVLYLRKKLGSLLGVISNSVSFLNMGVSLNMYSHTDTIRIRINDLEGDGFYFKDIPMPAVFKKGLFYDKDEMMHQVLDALKERDGDDENVRIEDVEDVRYYLVPGKRDGKPTIRKEKVVNITQVETRTPLRDRIQAFLDRSVRFDERMLKIMDEQIEKLNATTPFSGRNIVIKRKENDLVFSIGGKDVVQRTIPSTIRPSIDRSYADMIAPEVEIVYIDWCDNTLPRGISLYDVESAFRKFCSEPGIDELSFLGIALPAGAELTYRKEDDKIVIIISSFEEKITPIEFHIDQRSINSSRDASKICKASDIVQTAIGFLITQFKQDVEDVG